MRNRIDLQGHRGARGLFPENTIEGLLAGLAIGIDTFEIDIAVTADGVPVLSHDAALNPAITRGADGRWLERRGPLIRSLRVDELVEYDVGRIRPNTNYARLFPHQRPHDGARIPRLSDVLAVDSTVRFNIELKTYPDHPEWTATPAAMAEAVLATLDAAGADARVTIESFDWRGLHHLQCGRPLLPLAWLTRMGAEAMAALWWDGPRPEDFGGSVPRVVAAEGGRIWAPEHTSLTRNQLDEAHELTLKVIAWTVNTPRAMRRLMRCGIDGIITDRPDIARRVMAEEGFTMPARLPCRLSF
jgi:glycerophosphoryl diester phosphodiesterase